MRKELNCCQYAFAAGLLALAMAQLSLSPARIHVITAAVSLSLVCSSARKVVVHGSNRSSSCMFMFVRFVCLLCVRGVGAVCAIGMVSALFGCAAVCAIGAASAPLDSFLRCALVVTAHARAVGSSSKKKSSTPIGRQCLTCSLSPPPHIISNPSVPSI